MFCLPQVEIEPSAVVPTAAQHIPVMIEQTDSLTTDAIDETSLRFGAPDAIAHSRGATPTTVQHLGNGNITVKFASRKTGLSCGAAPAVGQLAGTFTEIGRAHV